MGRGNKRRVRQEGLYVKARKTGTIPTYTADYTLGTPAGASYQAPSTPAAAFRGHGHLERQICSHTRKGDCWDLNTSHFIFPRHQTKGAPLREERAMDVVCSEGLGLGLELCPLCCLGTESLTFSQYSSRTLMSSPFLCPPLWGQV